MAPPVAPHPKIDLVQAAAVAAVGPRVGGSAGELMAAEAVRYSGMRVSPNEAGDHGHAAQNVLDGADVEILLHRIRRANVDIPVLHRPSA